MQFGEEVAVGLFRAKKLWRSPRNYVISPSIGSGTIFLKICQQPRLVPVSKAALSTAAELEASLPIGQFSRSPMRQCKTAEASAALG